MALNNTKPAIIQKDIEGISHEKENGMLVKPKL